MESGQGPSWYQCVHDVSPYAQGIANLGTQFKLCFSEFLMGLHYIGMIGWLIVHGVERSLQVY